MSTQQESQQQEKQEKEVRQIFRIVKVTKKFAKNASFVGGLEGGEKRCIHQYNAALKRLIEIELVPQSLFEPLEEESSYSEICIAASYLLEVLREEFREERGEEEPEEEGEEKQEGGRHSHKWRKHKGPRGPRGPQYKDLRGVGEWIRESMPDFLGEILNFEEHDDHYGFKPKWKHKGEEVEVEVKVKKGGKSDSPQDKNKEEVVVEEKVASQEQSSTSNQSS